LQRDCCRGTGAVARRSRRVERDLPASVSESPNASVFVCSETVNRDAAFVDLGERPYPGGREVVTGGRSCVIKTQCPRVHSLERCIDWGCEREKHSGSHFGSYISVAGKGGCTSENRNLQWNSAHGCLQTSRTWHAKPCLIKARQGSSWQRPKQTQIDERVGDTKM
jgi:hypothetical protein